jgi:hypothetical protein
MNDKIKEEYDKEFSILNMSEIDGNMIVHNKIWNFISAKLQEEYQQGRVDEQKLQLKLQEGVIKQREDEVIDSFLAYITSDENVMVDTFSIEWLRKLAQQFKSSTEDREGKA